ncbi:glycosyltransferase family 2 protein [Brevibacillus thermoruber]|uniref:Glycosyltransferase family 2 protein n=1 Tax=Brevibacillus thermoruber TaxID=33942 RepID=A0A9X3TUM7_9BACL|nr:glycosyltransferase family 2 protein [Brevibacillus thermoruber]MDA5110862.1 glycosyltransferase family 2 protein [Brevibacillus thermoruber]
MSDQFFPLVSIITPSFNQARFIRETIESVLNQDYPHLEHIVIDGGSTDGTLEILNHFRQTDNRFRFVSEPDRGQSHAINKGLAMAAGEIIGWVNSDDTYQPGAIRKAVQALQQRPEWAMVHGGCYVINENSQIQSSISVAPADYQKLYHSCCVCQPAAFIRKDILQQMGGVDETLNFCMDYDLWIRIAKNHLIGYVPDHLANARIHRTAKSVTQWHSVGLPEVLKTVEKHYGSISKTWLAHAPHYRKRETPRPHPQQQVIHSHPVQPKNLSSIGHPDRVTSMNRYADLWVPPQFHITIEATPGSRFHTLLVKGRALALRPGQPVNLSANILVNGRSVGTYQTSGQSFVWEIPLDHNQQINQVTILSSRFLTDPNSSHRMICFIADEVVPLTAGEADYYKRN